MAPRDLVKSAVAAGVEILCLSDHDSVSGFPEARESAQGAAMKVFCGVEISTSCSENVHILGYGISWQDPVFLDKLKDLRLRRVERARLMIENLRKMGVDISLEDVQAVACGALGRAHIAEALRRKGVVPNRPEAFRRFLGAGKPGYVASLGPTPQEAIRMIQEAGGFAAVAHPGTIPDKQMIDVWAQAGLEAIEVYYGAHSPSEVVRFQEMSHRLGLLQTGGSDFHGPGSGRDIALGVDMETTLVERFVQRLSRCA